jgi:hypothetical protein
MDEILTALPPVYLYQLLLCCSSFISEWLLGNFFESLTGKKIRKYCASP